MRDSRVSFFTSQPATATTVTTATTQTGTTIDLKSGFTGTYFEGAGMDGMHGLGIVMLFTVNAGTANNVDAYWETSDNGSTWEHDAQIMTAELSVAVTGGTKYEIGSQLHTPRRYCRIKVVSTTMTGGSSFTFNTWVNDGTPSFGFGEPTARI